MNDKRANPQRLTEYNSLERSPSGSIRSSAVPAVQQSSGHEAKLVTVDRDCDFGNPFYRMSELAGKGGKTRLSRSTIYARVLDGTFPKPVVLSPGVVAWTGASLREWAKGLCHAR